MARDSSGNVSINRDRAVTGQKVLAEQVNVPFDDVQAMLNLVAWRDGLSPMTGNQNLNGFRVTNAGEATGNGDLVTLGQLNAAIAALQNNSIPTGTRGEFYMNFIPTGWVYANGETIGSASSGATNRANADTRNLYILFWNSFDNSLLPIQNSSGAPTTRGGSAASDFDANKRLPVFNDTGIYTRGSGGNGAGNPGTYQDDAIKSHTHSGTTGAGSPHQHGTGAGNYTVQAGSGGSFPGFGNQFSVQTTFEDQHTHPFTTNATGDTETRPKTRAVLVGIKL